MDTPRMTAALARLREPDTHTDLIQLLKSVSAAVVAWVLAHEVMGLDQAFLAPWTALLTVHATVYRSMSRGVQSVAATGIGIGVSFAVAELVGIDPLTIGLALLIGLLVARIGMLRAEGVTVATTALFVLTAGYDEQQAMLLDRILDVVIGAAVGLIINLVVYPPLNDRSAQHQIDRINRRLGTLMMTMASGLRSGHQDENSSTWIEKTREIDGDLDRAWQLVSHARESAYGNPRRRLRRSTPDHTHYSDVLTRLEEGVAQVRTIARAVHESTRTAQEWDPRFRDPWIDLLDELGQRVADPEATVESLQRRINDFTRELSGQDLPGLLWPLYGTLISSLINVVDIVDDVASASPVRT